MFLSENSPELSFEKITWCDNLWQEHEPIAGFSVKGEGQLNLLNYRFLQLLEVKGF